VLDLAKIEAGKQNLTFEPIAPAEIVDEVARLRPSCGIAGVGLLR
jgi:hypothetical protein